MPYVQTVLIQGTGASALTSERQAMYNAEAEQPEGTEMELIVTLATPSYLNVANPQQDFANAVNLGMQAKSATPWSGSDTFATVSGDQIIIRWRKEGPFVWILVGIILGIALYVWITDFVLKKQSLTSAVALGTGTTTGTLLLWGIGGVLVIGILVSASHHLGGGAHAG